MNNHLAVLKNTELSTLGIMAGMALIGFTLSIVSEIIIRRRNG